jgi:hypothetical protein
MYIRPHLTAKELTPMLRTTPFVINQRRGFLGALGVLGENYQALVSKTPFPGLVAFHVEGLKKKETARSYLIPQVGAGRRSRLLQIFIHIENKSLSCSPIQFPPDPFCPQRYCGNRSSK